jgi:molecular chaperone IbpA
MVNKQFRITSDTLNPLYRATIGFDNLFNEFERLHTQSNSQGYPPYNISKDGDDLYSITLAIAGFKKSEIDVELEDGNLLITGTVKSDESATDDIEYLHKGIAERDFVRSFKLAEYVEVKDAKLEDGLLKVELFRNVPDALKPQKIKIT